jgi:hypothetical protein
MTIRKPNRVTTPKRAVLNGTRTSHASMPRAHGGLTSPEAGPARPVTADGLPA